MLHFKPFTISICLIFLALSCPGQTPLLDSLQEKMAQYPANDTMALLTLNRIAEEYVKSGDERAGGAILELETRSKAISWSRGELLALSLKAQKDENQANWMGALVALQELLDRVQELGDQGREITIRIRMAGIHFRAGDYDSAVAFALEAQKLCREPTRPSELGKILTLLGAVYMTQARVPEMPKEESDSLLELSAGYFREALEIAKGSGDDTRTAISYSNLSAVSMIQGKGDLALDYAKQALNSHQERGQIEGQIISSINVGESYLRLGRYPESIPFFESALDLAQRHRFNQFRLNALGSLSTAHRRMGHTEEALSFLDRHYILKDSIFNVEKAEALAAQSARYEKEKTDQENEWLEQRNEILGQQNLVISLIGGAMLLLVIAMVFVLIRLRRQNRFIADQKRQLQDLDALRTRFFGIIAHDLRNPVLGFRGIVDKVNYLIENGQPERLQAFGQELTHSADSLQLLLDNLLKWALSQRGAIPFYPDTIDLRLSAQTVLDQLSPLVAAKQLEVNLDIPQGLVVKADPTGLSVMLRNLVHNAIKYSSPGGKISLQGKSAGEQVEMYVEDTGKGIADLVQEDLFIPGKISPETGTEGERGTGLGLPLVWELVQMHQGNMRLDSQPGIGTKVRLTLPKG